MLNMLRYSLLLAVPMSLSYIITDQMNGYLYPRVSYWNPFEAYTALHKPLIFTKEAGYPTDLTLYNVRPGLPDGARDVSYPQEFVSRTGIPEYFFQPRIHGHGHGHKPTLSVDAEPISLPPPIKKPPEFKLKFEIPKFLKFSQSHHSSPAKLECEKLNGKLVLEKCYQFVHYKSSFTSASLDCRYKGGNLWTPDLNNPALLIFLAQDLPEFAQAHEQKVWLGASVIYGKLKTLDGQDITNNFLSHINCDSSSLTDFECLIMDFTEGGLCIKSRSCSKDHSYVCEFPLHSNQEVSLHKMLSG